MTPETLAPLIVAARERIRAHVRHTPLDLSLGLSDTLDLEVHLKCEHLQHSGSFKYRGATNKLMSLSADQRAAGVITASSGNHGLGVATAGRVHGVRPRIFLPNNVSPTKLSGIRALGALVELVDGDAYGAELEAIRTASSQGATYISPYNDAAVMAGQGTIGLEILDDFPEVEAVFISVGGGGLIGGIGTALKAARPNIAVIGCWPENAPALMKALETGAIHPVPEQPTLSDGTAGGVEEDSITFPVCQQVIDRTIAVSEDEIRAAMRDIGIFERWMVEGAAGVALAGLASLRAEFAGKKCAVVLCGRNIALDKYTAAVGL